MIDQLQHVHAETRALLDSLQRRVDRLDVGPEWNSSLRRLVRELGDQLEHAVNQAHERADQAKRRDENMVRFKARPPRLR
ncbi:hypothetical protein [Saccharopolyspora endophytica]|uniref:Uncharacterized protein n=1 Tax=Saccharopolyspora endophytica TaxID=543886 RepID=A0ABS5DFR5_9PSEU|nr:hypothetical protein [Saccharopolyspora endophytica]MBQ0924982.1 hypothetical protein [Saccharopolyspora endophytica]